MYMTPAMKSTSIFIIQPRPRSQCYRNSSTYSFQSDTPNKPTLGGVVTTTCDKIDGRIPVVHGAIPWVTYGTIAFARGSIP